VPGTGFETPRVHRQVEFRRAPSGSDRVTPFLTVDHSVGMLLDDELILSGRGEQSDDLWNYTVRPLVNQSRSQRSGRLTTIHGKMDALSSVLTAAIDGVLRPSMAVARRRRRSTAIKRVRTRGKVSKI